MNPSKKHSPTGGNDARPAAALAAATLSLLSSVILGREAWQGRLGGAALLALVVATATLVLARRWSDERWRTRLDWWAKVALTVIGSVALLRHPIEVSTDTKLPVYEAIAVYIRQVDPWTFTVFALLAMLVKSVGIVASGYAWHILLVGQRVRFPFWSGIMTAFMIGRFLGTFLPSTIGLDGYTLYEAGRYSNQWARCTTAKALEKVIGSAGLFAGMVITLPFGYPVLVDVTRHLGKPEAAPVLAIGIALVAGGISLGVLALLLQPKLLTWGVGAMGGVAPKPIAARLDQLKDALEAYRGQTGILVVALGAKFISHFTTAVVYYFTALAIGVVGAQFWPIVFGSTIQILATLLSPTIAGEGAREAFQALLLSHQLGGVAQAVLSAALGFLAAEAATLWGGIFLWTRSPRWRPKQVLVDGQSVDFAWLEAAAAERGDGYSFRQAKKQAPSE